ncbi:MAG: SET domain-containing protein-lysine N-methyltransferase [Actinomycetia bacterium]|nr:SET domain-containing protein-lysine N-methyltransferase [Actinomycetes bacterium]
MKFIARKSCIHGKGLYTCRPIKKGEVLGGLGWRPCNSKEEENGNYGCNWNDGTVRFITCDFKYINHSDFPNVVIYDDCSIVALRDISSGEEILSDYGEWKPNAS